MMGPTVISRFRHLPLFLKPLRGRDRVSGYAVSQDLVLLRVGCLREITSATQYDPDCE